MNTQGQDMQSEIKRLQDAVNGLRQLCRDAADFCHFSQVGEIDIEREGEPKRTITRDEITERLRNA